LGIELATRVPLFKKKHAMGVQGERGAFHQEVMGETRDAVEHRLKRPRTGLRAETKKEVLQTPRLTIDELSGARIENTPRPATPKVACLTSRLGVSVGQQNRRAFF
jgi:hypothetical protein